LASAGQRGTGCAIAGEHAQWTTAPPPSSRAGAAVVSVGQGGGHAIVGEHAQQAAVPPPSCVRGLLCRAPDEEADVASTRGAALPAELTTSSRRWGKKMP